MGVVVVVVARMIVVMRSVGSCSGGDVRRQPIVLRAARATLPSRTGVA
jgi:hypothetical protein